MRQESDGVSAALDDYRWLVSDAADPWLTTCADNIKSGPTFRLTSRLRRDLSLGRAHLILEQVELRRRAREKFSRAEEMFFTFQSLQQATDEQIAAYKAERFPAGEPAVDLCCGIGGDLIALAQRGPVQGVDCEAVAVLLAAANLAVCGVDGDRCGVTIGDATQFPLGQSSWHCDPDRRTAGRRTTRGEWMSPPLNELSRLLLSSDQAAVKLAPATDAPPDWSAACELEWIGSRGECRQQVAWFGSLARHTGRRSATIIARDAEARTIVGDAHHILPPPAKIGRFLYEPHAAVLAAGLTGVVCELHGLAPIASGVAYLTGEKTAYDAAMDAFEVRDVLPLDRKQLRAYCREHRLARLEIKKRGVDVEPQRLRQEIVGEGDEETVLLIAPIGEHVRAIVARRLRNAYGSALQ